LIFIFFNERTKNQKTDKCSSRKKQTDKHFEIKQNAVLRNRASKNEWTNLIKKKKMQFVKNEQTNISKNRQM